MKPAILCNGINCTINKKSYLHHVENKKVFMKGRQRCRFKI